MANYNSRHTGAEIDNCVDTYQSQAQVVAAINAAKLAMFPVGSVYITINDNNPALFIGGTWTRIGQGRTLIGVGTGTDDNSLQEEFQPNESGGEYTHTLSVSEMPAHRHWISGMAWDDGNCSGSTGNGQDFGVASDAGSYTSYDQCKGNGRYDAWCGGAAAGGASGKGTNSANGYANDAHTNIQPYITVFFWQRTA